MKFLEWIKQLTEQNFFYLKKTILLLFVLISLGGYAIATPIPISLGPNCAVGLALKHHQIRKYAYPFDWVVTPFDSLYRMLDTDFENFFLKHNLIIDPNESWFVRDTYTGITFNHDFPIVNESLANFYHCQDIAPLGCIVKNFLDFYDLAAAKYQRRIKRFRKVLQSTNKVLLMRCATSKAEAMALRDLIEKKYPNLNFELIAINNGDNFNQDGWNERKIRSYNVQGNLYDGSLPGWTAILQDLQLLP